MLGRFKRVAASVSYLAAGEIVSNFGSFVLVAYISRHSGVELLGIVALAQTAARYVTLGADQGLRLVGSRLVARDKGAASIVVRPILLRRILFCGICVLGASVYALYGPVPQPSRPYIVGFAFAVFAYAFSLDWLAWGLDKFAWLGAFRGGVSTLFVTGAVIGLAYWKPLPALILSNAFATCAGTVVLWIAWRFRWKSEIRGASMSSQELLRKELHWFTVIPLGMATILNQAFHNADTLVLGAMSSASEVGRYSSAYRILFLVLSAYWLLTNSLYPSIARAKGGPDTEKLLRNSLLLVASCGLLLSLATAILAPTILTIVYGTDLGATPLLRILALAIPMDFCVALLGTAFVSRGRDRLVLASTGTAAGLNLFLNFFLIPRYQSLGAAYATLISYGCLLIFLGWPALRQPVFALDRKRPLLTT